jgi:hypothetical protein
MTRDFGQQDGAANGHQPIRSETNPTLPAPRWLGVILTPGFALRIVLQPGTLFSARRSSFRHPGAAVGDPCKTPDGKGEQVAITGHRGLAKRDGIRERGGV